MKIIIIILIVALSFMAYEVYKPEIKFYPVGDNGGIIPYYTNPNMAKCDICGKDTLIFKVDSKGRKVCNQCYRTRFVDK